MKIQLLCFVLILLAVGCYGQQELPEFGDVSIRDLDNKTFSGDTASAIVLFDKGSLVVDPGSVAGTTIKRHMRIKIIRKESFNEWGSRHFFVNKEGQLKVRAATYNLENGKIQKSEVSDESVKRNKFNKDIEEISIAFPNVKVGSVIEFIYTEKDPSLYMPSWKFQHSIPTRWSEYSISVPIIDYVSHLRGPFKPAKHETKYEGKYQSWLMTDLPPFVAEPLMPDKDIYISAIEFAVKHISWSEIYAHLTLSQHFGEIIHKHKFLKDIVEEITAGSTEPRQKIKAISNYIKKQIQFNGVFDFYALSPSDLLDKKTGSAGDINLLFASMMEKAGLKVNMVLLSTRDNGYILEGFPSLSQFDYVICEVTLSDGELLVDATEKHLPYDLLPPRCFNHKGFLIGSGEYGWISVEPVQRERITLEADFTLTESGGIKGRLKSYKDGYAAFQARKKYWEEDRKEFEHYFPGSKVWTITNFEILNMNVPDKTVIENYDVEVESVASISGELIYLNPHIFLREDTNPFTTESRDYPIDFPNLKESTMICNLAIPDGYVVEELPQNKVIALPGGAAKCTFSVSQTGNKVMVMSKLQFNKTLFQPSEYGNLKEFYARLVSKKSENIVFKRKA